MKFKKFNFFNAKWFLILGLFLSSLSVLRINAQSSQDIMLYSTDFTGWTAVSGIESNGTYPQSTGDGAGFILDKKPEIAPSGTINGYTGYYTNASSSHTITFPALNFVSGGVVEVVYCVDQGSGVTITMSGADYVKFEEINDPSNAIGTNYKNIKAGGEALGDKNGWFANYKDWHLGNNVTARYEGTYYKILFSFPSSFKGEKVLTLASSKQYDKIVSMKVWTSVGTTPYVAATDYPNAGADGTKTSESFKINGDVGGAKVNGVVGIKGFNLTQDVQISIEGKDASKFSLGTTTISAADAMAGTNVAIDFSPSVKAGNATALLKLSSGSNDYYVNILGITGSGNPQIVASTAQLNFWTSLIAPREQVLQVSGLNLTGPLTLNVVGAGADRFTLSTNTLSVLEASKGYDLNISFLGEILENEVGLDATLELSSPGAVPVSIPLKGITSGVKPVLYNFTFEVQPAGTAFVDCNLGGTVFLEGTVLNATVTLENGYRIKYWSDNVGTTKAQRSFKVTENKHVVIFTEKGIQIEGPTTTDVQAFVPLTPANITTTSMTLQWTPQDNNAGGYTVNVYNADGSLFKTLTSTTTSVLLDGLTEDTEYYYGVVGDNGVLAGAASNPKIGPFRTAKTVVPAVCGENIINQ